MNIKKGDNIVVVTGKDKGKKAKVLKSLPARGLLLVEGVNLVKKHQKKRSENQKGQTVTKAMPLNASNVMIFCSRCEKGTRIGSKVIDNKKLRICAGCKSEM
ncbi:MAG: 50S ribosomal protein L24 [Patescibacteria group bacterium]